MAENEDIILLESVELGDIIRLQAPSNIDIHNQTFYVYFVDRDKLKMLNTTSEKEYLLPIRDFVQDETIIGIDLVSRSPERGFAAQHGLVPGQWIDLYFGGDHASLVWGKITGLEEDMIQVMLYSVEDNPGPIYIDFAYEGIPEDSMIEKIVVRPPPHDARELQEKYLPLGTTLDHYETTEEAVEEEKEPSIPTNNQIVEEFLQADDEVSNIDFFENELDDIFVEVAVSEEHRRFSEAMQLAELTNHLLSKYPLSERTVNVHRYVHFLVSRFRQLRREFSEFRDGRIVMARRNDFSHNPITEAFTRMRTSVPWVIPVVYERTRLYKSYGKYSTEDVIDFEDLGYDEHPLYVEEPEAVVLKDLVEELKDFEKQFAENRPETLKHFAEFIANEFVTYANPPEFGQKSSYNEQTVFLRNVPVQEDAEVLVGNNHTLHKDPAGDFQCSVVSKAKDDFLGKRHVGSFVNRRYNAQLGLGGKADKVHIRSVLLLPKSVCLQSAAFTGKSSIYMRSLRSQTPLYKFKLLNKHAQIERRVVDGIEFGETEQSNGFLKKPTHYVLNKQFNGVNAVSNFQSFLDDILPKPSLLLKWMEDNIPQANTTLLKMTDLEPYFQAFLVESDFLSSDTWEVLSKFLNEQQKNMFRAFTEAKKRATEYIRAAPAVHLKQVNATPYGPVNVLKSQLLEPLREQKSLQKQIGKIFESRAQFQYEPSSEILQQLLEGDYAKTLTTFIHSTVFDRITLLDAAFLDKLVKPALVEGDVVATKNLTKCDVVRPQVIAKRYSSLASLHKDNGKASLYFDKEFDDTPYHLVDLYKDEKARFSDNEEKFHEFFAQTLINKHSCPAAMADELATNIINKRKPVKDGHYAVWNDEEDARYYKYHANKRQWVLDKDVDVNKFMSPNELFCELTSATECVKVDDINRCIPMEMEAVRMRMARRSQILTEFNTRIAKSFREMKTQLEKDKKTVFAEFENRQTAATKQRQRQSHWSYRLGEKLVGALELAESPHAATMEDILAWDNFRERQLMIREFRKKFCREPIVDAEENPFWLYCTESNLPLLPKSLSLLADAEANGTYIEVMEHLLGTVGEKSDDYDSIVDKHTGFVLQKLQFFDEDSVNEDGTKRTTHGVLDADPVFIEGGAMATSSVHVVPVAFANNTTMQQCYRVLSTLCKNMHVPLRFDLEDFVLHTASNFMQYMFTEETYNKNKKNTVSYQDQKDYFVIFSVAAALLIGLQTSIPHTDTESAMIGCRKSFAGFPLDLNEHETQGIEYIACALHKTNPKTDVPWIAVKSKNEEFFKRGLLAALKNLGMKPVDVAANKTKKIGLLDLPEVKAVLLKKRDWLEQHPQDAAEISQGDITTLQRMFLPPLVHTHLKIGEDVHGITEAQEASVLADLKAGSKQQHKQIMQTHAKIIKHGYAMHQVIAGEMSRAPPLSVKALRPPLFYFAEKAKELELLQQRSIAMEHLLQRVRQFTAPETFYCYGNSRIESGPLDSTIHSKVVFLSFMHYCNFENDAPIPEYLRGLVSEKPAYDKNSTFEEKVNFMKLNQMNFSLEQFHRLMHLVNGKNKVAVPEHPPVTDADTAAASAATTTNDENTGIINEIIRKHLSNLLEANHANDRELMEASSKALQNYLTVTIRKLMNSADSASTSITDFMDTFLMFAESGKKSTVEQEKTKFVDFFMKKSLADWKNKDEGVILQQMHNAVANFAKVYPAYLFGPMNSRQKFRADDKTLPFAAEHKDIVLLTSLHKRLQLDKFTSVFKGGDERLQNIVREGMRRSAHVLVFLETLSAAHKTLLPKQVLYLLYRYCAVSVINEYINVASSNYPLNSVSLKPSESTIQGVRPVRVDMSANKENEQLYQHLASLLHMFVHLEQDDNRQIDLDYAQIMFATTELKRAETKRILDNLGKMTPEQKESAMRRKQYRIGEYSGYSGKQLTGYTGAQWMKEANDLTEYYDAVIESANIDELNNMNEAEDPSVPNDPDEYDGNDDND